METLHIDQSSPFQIDRSSKKLSWFCIYIHYFYRIIRLFWFIVYPIIPCKVSKSQRWDWELRELFSTGVEGLDDPVSYIKARESGEFTEYILFTMGKAAVDLYDHPWESAFSHLMNGEYNITNIILYIIYTYLYRIFRNIARQVVWCTNTPCVHVQPRIEEELHFF